MYLTSIMAKKYQLLTFTMLVKITWLVCLSFGFIQLAQAKAPHILTTIKPVHSLVSNLTRGIGQPDLLIEGSQSPHDFQMKPSDRRKIARADIIIYVSNSIESYMAEISNTFTGQQTIIQLAKTADLNLLAARAVDPQHEHHAHHADLDGHIWLSINNAKAISEHLYNLFIQHDPQHQAIYLQNRNQLIDRLDQLKTDITRQLSRIHQKPYLTFHDAFQYFETEFSLTGSHFVTANPEHIAGIKSIQRLKKLIQTKNIQCIYYEPPQAPKIIQILKDDTQARVLALDPIGTNLKPGETLYFELLNSISSQLYDCLK